MSSRRTASATVRSHCPTSARFCSIWLKTKRQTLKDYVAFPLLAGPFAPWVFTGNMTANLMRNVWSYMIIFCGHFPADVQQFSIEETKAESRGQWYFRQVLGSANLTGGKLFHILSGNLSFQIEHHLFPDLPSNRLPQIAVRVREVCDKYDLPYTISSLARQYFLVLRTIHKLALPDRFLVATSDDAPETASERKFLAGPNSAATRGGRMAGLRTALRARTSKGRY